MKTSTLALRAKLLADIRAFFAKHNVMEVDVPALGATTVTDVHLNGLDIDLHGRKYFLQTSPEFFMKRLLAGGSGSIYYLGKAFRDDHVSKRHNPEFTMLEWYREGYDDVALIEDALSLIRGVSPGVVIERFSYRDLFKEYLGVDPHIATADELASIAKQKLDIGWEDDDKSTWLDLLFSHCIEPELQNLTVVYDYPVCQCALARITQDESGEFVARRFELFWQGLELANGYWELTDPKEQAERFAKDVEMRRSKGLPEPEVDEKFISALEAGLPECAGIALGVDRLFMCLMKEKDIMKAIPFPLDHL